MVATSHFSPSTNSDPPRACSPRICIPFSNFYFLLKIPVFLQCESNFSGSFLHISTVQITEIRRLRPNIAIIFTPTMIHKALNLLGSYTGGDRWGGSQRHTSDIDKFKKDDYSRFFNEFPPENCAFLISSLVL